MKRADLSAFFLTDGPENVGKGHHRTRRILTAVHKRIVQKGFHSSFRMIRLVIGQLLKLKDRILRQAVSGVHKVFQNTLGRIIPAAVIIGSLSGTFRKGTVHQTLSSHKLVGYHSIPVKPRVHCHKGPVGMLFFQCF